jgi:hypothetical protein
MTENRITPPVTAVRVDIAAPDGYAAAVLLGEAGTLCPAELVADESSWIVRLEPPADSAGWVVELLEIVERWLDGCALPVANLVYGGRSYLIGGSRRPAD